MADKTTDNFRTNENFVFRNRLLKGGLKTMRGRFTRQQLHDTGNRIPIRPLMENELNVANRQSGNIFRFECPACRGYHTSIKAKTNLARCFDCNRNFNTIEMVMETRKTEFYESALFLWNLLVAEMKIQAKGPGPVRNKREIHAKRKPAFTPVSIARIFENAGFAIGGNGFAGQPPDSVSMGRRIENLEKETNRLKMKLEQLQKFVTGMIHGWKS
jgi:hypothetical protein